MLRRLLEKSKKWQDDPTNAILGIDLLFLCIHVFLEFCYAWVYSVPLIVINVFSIVLYLVLIGVIRAGFVRQAVYCMYIEILAHSVLASLFMGWESGFQLWIVGLIVAYLFPIMTMKRSKNSRRLDNFLLFFGFLSFGIYMALFFLYAFGITAPVSAGIGPRTRVIANGMNSVIVLLAVLFFTVYFLWQMRNAQDDLRSEARHDPLTGLYNRYALNQVVTENFFNANTYGEYLCLCIADIDFFKKVNDTYGHDAGDAVLKAVASLILKNVDGDMHFGARWGGEEFILISLIRPEKMKERMEEFRKAVSDLNVVWNGQTIHVTISIGGSSYKAGLDYETLLREADESLYYVKQNGRNAVRIVTHSKDGRIL